jgi:hypothetical protein
VSAPLFCAALALFLTPAVASADVPAAAQLLDQTANPYTSTGVRVTVSNAGSMYGIANDRTSAYIINSSGDIYTVPLAPLAALSGGSATSTNGVLHSVGWGSGGAPSWPNSSQGSIIYSHGCVFMTSAEGSGTTPGSIELYCIDTSDYSVTQITVPPSYPLPNGNYFAYSNLVDFPDGRIGKVSKYVAMGGGVYRSTLRLYTISGTGKSATLTWSEDIQMSDSSNWAVDEHGLGTDGTYLYRIQWRDVNPNTKVWQLASGATSTVVYSGGFTRPFDNMHFLSHNHAGNYYLVGYYSQNQFFITGSADPGPGPGNPLTPTFATPAYSSTGFTVQVTNYDGAFAWTVTTNAGSASINGSGLITVSGLSGEGASATITASTTKSGIPDGGASTTGTIPDITVPVLTGVASAPSNTSASITWNTNETASTKVVYSTNSAYASSTTQTDTSPRVMSHSKSLSGLISCTLYNYKAVSADAAGNYATSTDNTFTTTGCPGGATPTSATSTSVTVSAAATRTLTDSGRTFSVATPANVTATSSSIVIQIKGLASDTVLGSIGKPSSSLASAASIVFDVTALINETTVLDSFDHPVTITYQYADADVSGLDESSLTMYHYHAGAWLPLDNCSVDAAANTITCSAPSFSTFAIFGSPTPAGSSRAKHGTSIPEQVANLVAMGKTKAADTLKSQWPQLFAQAGAAPEAACARYDFARQLKFGSEGEDVRALQVFLNCAGFTLAASGPGSPGHETAYFVDRTLDSLKRFQQTYAADILAPIGAAVPTGIFAQYSSAKAYTLMQSK